MPGQPRPNKKANKILYAIMKTPKDLQQESSKRPSKRLLEEWFKDSSSAQ